MKSGLICPVLDDKNFRESYMTTHGSS